MDRRVARRLRFLATPADVGANQIAGDRVDEPLGPKTVGESGEPECVAVIDEWLGAPLLEAAVEGGDDLLNGEQAEDRGEVGRGDAARGGLLGQHQQSTPDTPRITRGCGLTSETAEGAG